MLFRSVRIEISASNTGERTIALAPTRGEGKTQIVEGSEVLHENVLSKELEVSQSSFWQSNERAPELLTNIVLEFANLRNGDHVLDLYGGVGLFTSAMIDLATLTGAILVALGQENAGLFSNSDSLSENLTKAGKATGETVWRLPLGPVYDKMIDSKFADMKNTGGRFGGSITAAQFLQRFVGDTPWAHLDIAGTAMSSPETDINKSWASGWGVRLLDRLVADYYEDRD